MLEKLSIEWKLPLAICTVLMTVVAALSMLAYHQVADSAHAAAAERVENFATQLAASFDASVDKGLVRLGARVSQDPFTRFLRSSERTGSAAEETRSAVEDLLVQGEVPVEYAAVQLLDLDRRCLIAAGPDVERISALPVDDLIPLPPPKTGGVGTLVALGERVVVPAFVPVLHEQAPVGYFVRWSYVALSPETRERISGFLAPEASAFLGASGGLWIDWERVVPQPALDLAHTGKTVRVPLAEGAQLAAAAHVARTPWFVVVQYPELLVLAPARRFLERIGAAALLLLLVGFGGVWLVARRITAPLRELTLASESLAGNSQAAEGMGVGEDELGRLRKSFDRMSERVLEAHRRLESKVEELRSTQDREQAARAEAEAANSRKDEFLAMLAHELRNPLSPIVCALAVLRSSQVSREAREEALAVLERQVRNVTRIVDDLLDVSRITRGRITLQRRRFDVGTLVRNAVETSRPLIEARRHRVRCTLPDEPLTVEVDETRMEQVLANLVTNAAKYTEPGGQIWVSAERAGNDVVFCVRDDGIGIPADRLGAIFDLFHQVEHSIDRSRGGLGIGLTLVRKLVELHGGSVTAASGGLGQGSVFVVRIPAADAAADGVETPALADARAAEARRVLLVEDARDTRELLARVLVLEGHQVATAEDGEEGLARFRTFEPHVVLLDIGLPGMDGFEVARRMRAEGGPEVLLIAATGYGDAETRSRAREVGFDEHFVKPVVHAQLRTLLARGRAQRAIAVAEG